MFYNYFLNSKSKTVRQSIIASLIVSNILSFTGCSNKKDCDILEKHAHFYVDEDNFGRYIVSENKKIGNLKKYYSYIPVYNNNDELLDFINKNDLFVISDNKQEIDKIVSKLHDHKEYRYYYFYNDIDKITHYDGFKETNSYYSLAKKGYSWSENEYVDNLTGETRYCHYMYRAYKIVKNNKEFKLVESDLVESLDDLSDEYIYIDKNFYIPVNLYNKKEILSYEDGSHIYKDIISEDEYYGEKDKVKK